MTERVQRLERAGVITGYRMQVDPAALGMPVTAFARVRPAAGQLPKVAELAAALPQVTECHRITGGLLAAQGARDSNGERTRRRSST